MAVPGIKVSTKLTATDLFWWRVDEPQNPMVINILVEFEGVLTPVAVRNALEAAVAENIRLHGVPTSRFANNNNNNTAGAWGLLAGCLAVLTTGSQWYWKPVPHFSLEEHIRLHVLEERSEDCLRQFVDEEISHQLPKDRAQWRGIVIHNTPGSGSRALFRFHHVIADGAGLGQWFYGLCQVHGPPTGDSPHEVPEKQAWVGRHPSTLNAGPPPKRTAVQRLRKVAARVRDVVDFLLLEVLLVVYSAMKLLFLSRDSNSPFKGPNTGRKKTGTTLHSLDLPVEAVKALGKGYDRDITVNDVLCTLLAGAFRRFFQRHLLHPEQMSMRVAVPINMRSSIRPPITMDNRFSLVFKSLPIHLPTVQERLASFHVRMGLMKMSIEPRLGLLLMYFLAWMPERVLARVIEHFTLCTSAVLTNVMSSRIKLSFAGQPMDNMCFWVPTSGDIGLGISVCTYCDRINLGLVVDENLLADVKPLLADVVAEWDDMQRQLSAQGAAHPSSVIPAHTQEMIEANKQYGNPGHSR